MMDWELDKAKTLINQSLRNLEMGADSIDLSGSEFGPYHLKEGLYALGYDFYDFDSNSYDYWWYFKKDSAPKVCIFFDARTFELTFSLMEEEY